MLSAARQNAPEQEEDQRQEEDGGPRLQRDPAGDAGSAAPSLLISLSCRLAVPVANSDHTRGDLKIDIYTAD